MDYNDLHDPLQSAYKTAHSTESALLKVKNDILRTVDHGGVVVLVLLDLSAAFDTIDQSILLDRKRHQLGVNGVAHTWFESYLTGRTQRIRIGDAWSLAKFLLYCVPQGSVLGPLLLTESCGRVVTRWPVSQEVGGSIPGCATKFGKG